MKNAARFRESRPRRRIRWRDDDNVSECLPLALRVGTAIAPPMHQSWESSLLVHDPIRTDERSDRQTSENPS
jgi:hypothetical protein